MSQSFKKEFYQDVVEWRWRGWWNILCGSGPCFADEPVTESKDEFENRVSTWIDEKKESIRVTNIESKPYYIGHGYCLSNGYYIVYYVEN
uniref:Uncharacterized protein n=1 Tax=Marseillevirus LCMAC201 TaxID=2506605 RepID=A0A481YVM1_9VIRU|nr:MAG: hypothetical protein LCMAC201_00510 [Marseillevirus LCMAC201]